MRAEAVIVSLADSLFNLLSCGNPAFLNACVKGELLARLSERLDSNWKCHCIALKIPLPSCFFGGEQNHLRQKADQRLNSCQEQPLSSFSQFFSPALAHFFYICTWYPSFPFTQSPDLTSYFLLYVSPSSFLSCSMHNRVFNQFGESQLSLQIEIFCVLQRDGVGEGEKERETTRNLSISAAKQTPGLHWVTSWIENQKERDKRRETRGSMWWSAFLPKGYNRWYGMLLSLEPEWFKSLFYIIESIFNLTFDFPFAAYP